MILQAAASLGEAQLLGDVAVVDDDSVDVVLNTIGEMKDKIPQLWVKAFPA